MKRKHRRPVEVAVISDVHLGTYGCQARELLNYLKSINPSKLILNGDIIDIWQFSKRYWPSSHMQVVKHIMGLLSQGTEVIYITGNHDEMLRRFAGQQLGALQVVNKTLLNLDGKKTWIFHGDVFDITMQHSKWLARLGALGYDSLIVLNTFVNACLRAVGRDKVSLSKRVKDSVKSAIRFVNDFECTAAEIAIENNYDYVICGHIHQPQDRIITNEQGSVRYLNSGDRVENLTALEYYEGDWHLYHYHQDVVLHSDEQIATHIATEPHYTSDDLFKNLLSEFLIDPYKQ